MKSLTPASMGFRMPAEWEPHEATILTWPHDPRHWPGKFEKIPPIWARMVRELEEGEDVHIVIHDDKTEEAATKAMKEAKVQGDRVHLHRIPNNFAWVRDHGPIFVKRSADTERSRSVKNHEGERLMIDWGYNAWGGKWEHELDDVVPERISPLIDIPFVKGPMVLEGGSIDVNGQGTLMTTESCLLHPNRNPKLTKKQIEQNLKDYLGVTKVLWLGEGIVGDDTDGHIDDLTRFVGPRTVITVIENDPKGKNNEPLQDNLKRLETMTNQDDEPLEIIQIPLPKPVISKGTRLPASYANFYIANECVLLPVWNDPSDAAVVETLQKCFPTRRIVPIDSRELTWGFGSFHCVTQQMPQ